MLILKTGQIVYISEIQERWSLILDISSQFYFHCKDICAHKRLSEIQLKEYLPLVIYLGRKAFPQEKAQQPKSALWIGHHYHPPPSQLRSSLCCRTTILLDFIDGVEVPCTVRGSSRRKKPVSEVQAGLGPG